MYNKYIRKPLSYFVGFAIGWILLGAFVPVVSRTFTTIGDDVLVCSQEWEIIRFKTKCRVDVSLTDQ
ncbi:hypothetical protein D3C75_711300 [compost metagenome]